jgi:hypothetical protein
MTTQSEATEPTDRDVRRSALILPVPEVEPLVAEWRAGWDPNASLGVPAHITLLFPFLSQARITNAEVMRLRDWFSQIPEADISLTQTGRFEGVLYLAPEPDAYFRDITLRLWTMYPDTPPYGGLHDDIKPHLTVVQSDDEVVLHRAESELSRGLPVAGRAREAWLLLEAADGRWLQHARMPFGDGRG